MAKRFGKQVGRVEIVWEDCTLASVNGHNAAQVAHIPNRQIIRIRRLR